MPGIIADLEIDYTQAISGADDYAAALATALDTAAQLGAESIQSAIDAITTTPVDIPILADVAPATSEVTDLVAKVDAESAAISVDADTTQAVAAVDDLAAATDGAGSSASVASEKVSGLSVSTGQLAGVAGLAVGEVGGLKEASSLLGERTAVATTGALGLAVGFGELFHQGLNAVSAEERFNTALGEQAKAVQQVQIGSLNEDLFKLGATFGSADAAMRNATTSVYQFAINSGASKTQATQFADGIAAISARAVATKPSVGTLSDVMERAAIGIGRARTAASLLNIGLSTTEVNTRAADIAQQHGEASASAYDKSVAALQISIERFGPSLKQNITDGAENAANKEKALKAEFDNFLESAGKPLVMPALDLFKSAIPVGEDLGKVLSDVGTVAIPLLSGALQILGPLIEPVLVSLIAFKAISIGSEVAVALLQQASAWGILGAEAQTSAAEQGLAVASMEVSWASAQAAIIPGAIAFAAGFEGTMLAAHALGIEFTTYGELNKSEVDATNKASTLSGQALASAFDDLAHKAQDADSLGIGPLASRLKAFRDIAEQSLPKAAELADSTDHSTALYRGMESVLRSVIAAQHDQKTSTDEAGSSTNAQTVLNESAFGSLSDYARGTGDASSALKDLTASQKEENDAITLYKNNLLALQGVQGDITAATIAFKNSEQGVLDALAKNGVQFDLDTAAGRANVSALASSRDAADALAEATYKSELQTKGETQARKDADAVLSTFRGSLDTLLTSLGLNTQQVHDLETQLGLLAPPPPITPEVDIGPALQQLAILRAAMGSVQQGLSAGVPDIGGLQAYIDAHAGPGIFDPAAFYGQLGGYLQGRAGGGDVTAGVSYLVNENTPRSEIFTPSVSGTISTPAQWSQPRSSTGPLIGQQTNIFQAPVPSPAVIARTQARAARQAISMAAL
jgi:hypothetical protein